MESMYFRSDHASQYDRPVFTASAHSSSAHTSSAHTRGPVSSPAVPMFHPEELIPKFPRLGIFDGVHCFYYRDYSIVFSRRKGLEKKFLILSIFDCNGKHTCPLPKTELKSMLAYFDFHVTKPVYNWESPIKNDSVHGNTFYYAQEQSVNGVN